MNEKEVEWTIPDGKLQSLSSFPCRVITVVQRKKRGRSKSIVLLSRHVPLSPAPRSVKDLPLVEDVVGDVVEDAAAVAVQLAGEGKQTKPNLTPENKTEANLPVRNKQTRNASVPLNLMVDLTWAYGEQLYRLSQRRKRRRQTNRSHWDEIGDSSTSRRRQPQVLYF